MRKLTISDSINLNGRKEFNRLLIMNLDTFLIDYTNNLDYYKPPFGIMAELEKEILFDNNPKKIISIEYKEDGYIQFELGRMYPLGDLRVVEYSYVGTASL